MKIYTLATEGPVNYGHGGSGDECKIERQGGYGTGDYPPCFRTREDAQMYMDSLDVVGKHGKSVVELDLRD